MNCSQVCDVIFTPHKVSVLIMIKLLCDNYFEYSIQCRRQLSCLITELIEAPQLTITQIQDRIATFEGGEEVISALCQKLDSLKVLDCMINFFSDLDNYVGEGKEIRKDSLFGIYVRHMSVEFQKKDFTQTYELRNHICTFKHSAMDEVESIEYKPSAELINDQIRLLDTMESQAVSPQLLHGYIEKILKNSPNQPQMLFAKYLNYMRCKEYVQAINCLHHYFEEMDFRSTTNEQKLKKRFCYFPLNLAILHCLLGHNAEAIHALTEAIRLAQEGSDQECLLHAIHWLYWIKKEEHSTESLTLLNQLMKLSKNVSSKISGYAALNTIREEVLKGNEPSGIFYRLTTDDALISQSSLNDLSPTLFAEIAAIWSHYGINSLVVLHCQLLLGGFTNEDKRLNDEIIGLQFCKLSSYFEKEGYPSVAMKILDYALTIFPEHTEQAELLEISKKKLAFENALMKGEISLAKALSTELATTDSLEFSYSRAIIMKETNQFVEACNLLYKMLQDADEDKVILRNKLITLPQHRIRILRLLGEIYLESKQPCKAIEYFLQSVTCAYSYHLLDSMIASMIGLAEAQFSIGLSTTALDLLNDIAVSVSSFVSPILRAKFWTMTAKLHWKLANRRLPLRHILNLLDHAGTIFESRNYYFGLREVFYMKAMIYNELDCQEDRNKCAKQLLNLTDYLNSASI